MRLPGDREETPTQWSCVDNSLMNRAQDAIVNIYNSELFAERTVMLWPGQVQTQWSLNTTGLYWQSGGAGEEFLCGIEAPPYFRITQVDVRAYGVTGASMSLTLMSMRMATLDTEFIAPFNINHETRAVIAEDAWEVVALRAPVMDADGSNVSDEQPLVMPLNYGLSLSCISGAAGQRIAGMRVKMRRAI